MNIIETILVIFMIICLVLTAIQHPKLTFEFAKSYVTSTVTAVKWVIHKVGGINKEVDKNEVKDIPKG